MPVKALQTLLPLLDIKSEGRNPAGIFDGYMPSIDCKDDFLAQTQEVYQYIYPAGALGFNGPSVVDFVPDDEIWILHSAFTYESTIGAGSLRSVTLAMTDSGGLWHGFADLCIQGSGATFAAASSWSGLVYLKPGARVGSWNAIASAGQIMSTTLLFTRIKI